MNTIIHKKRWATPTTYIWVVLFAYVLVYAFAITFTYIEGDDATSIAYHAMGKNLAVMTQ